MVMGDDGLRMDIALRQQKSLSELRQQKSFRKKKLYDKGLLKARGHSPHPVEVAISARYRNMDF